MEWAGRYAERVFWCVLAVAVTTLLVAFRDAIGEAHIALAYLLVVLGASARGGRGLGMVLALLSFLAFNFFFIPPYHTLAIHNRLDWLVLVAFLLASGVATQLLHRAQAEAETARQRAQEIDRLASLGAGALSAGRAEEAVIAVAQVIQTGLNVAACEIYLQEARDGPARRVACALRPGTDPSSLPAPDPRWLVRTGAGLAMAERRDGSAHVVGTSDTLSAAELFLSDDAHALLIPLRVQERPIGVLRLDDPAGITLDTAQQRFAEALAHYAALALDRMQLSAAAEHAEALREADQLKDALLASVSHDLRTPLTTIKALAHDIASDGDDRARILEEEADRLNRFVSDLLDLSRLDAGALSVAPELVAAEDVLGVAIQQLSGTVNGRMVNASLDTSEPLLVGRFDFVHTLRALVNLIENALKYSPPQQAVDVTVRRDGSWLLFEVADRGPGVPADDRERIFTRFFRGAGHAHVVGTGLGLPIARRSVELQGGRLDFSPRAGGGSVFTLFLPAVDPSELERMSL